MDLTEGTLLAGRIRYAQPRDGFRSGIEPVFLAAAVPARAGQRVLEGGSGAGAALLCLTARVPGIHGLGIERDAALAGLAGRNAAANGFDRLRFAAGDVAGFRADHPFDHALANPPYHLESGTLPPGSARAAAKHAGAETLALWASSLAAALRPRGTLTLIVPAAQLAAAFAALAGAQCGAVAVFPLWPRARTAAKLVLVQGISGSRAASRMEAGLVLHTQDAGFSPEANGVLRAGSALLLRSG